MEGGNQDGPTVEDRDAALVPRMADVLRALDAEHATTLRLFLRATDTALARAVLQAVGTPEPVGSARAGSVG